MQSIIKENEALRDQQEWLRVTLSSIGDGVITTDTKGKVTFLNPVAQQLTGWTPEEANGKALEDVFHIVNETTRLAVDNPAHKALREGIVVGLANHTRLIARDGSEHPIDDSAAPIRNTAGEVAGIVLVFSDVTDRKIHEQIAKDALSYADNILATLREPFLVLDSNLRVVSANDAFFQQFSVTPGETVGHFVYELGNHQWDIPKLRTLLEDVLPDNHTFDDFEVDHVFATLGRKVMLLNARRIRRPGNHSELILLAIEDISERSRLEALQRVQAAELSDLHRRKDEFLAMLSHELRSPLAPIGNAVQLLNLQSEHENEFQCQAREIIERQLGKIQHLVDDLLDMSRISTGRIQLRKERVAMCTVVEAAVETARPLIEERRHVLTVFLPEEPIWLNADAARLEQVVANLLTNAAKYTAEGGRIILNLCRENEACVLRVQDNGAGITPMLLPRIFDLFTQAERSLDRSQGGLGIGLALVQRLTELHGGNVDVSSSLGQGSKFVVRLPIALEESASMIDPVAEDAESISRQLRVLVVDDNVDTVLSFSMLLRASGHKVLTAHDGPTAVRVANEEHPDAILLDIGLPGLNGYEVAKRIRQNPELNDAMLVALTGYGQDEDRQSSIQAGFNFHLVKPASFQQIKQILATISEQTR
jgi:PAS domain S-box-containing protein